MTYALIEDAGKMLAGRVLAETDASLQVELDSGKRVKAKAAQLLLRFAAPAPAALMASASAQAAEVDEELAWEFAPEGEFGFADLAAEYFGGQPGAPEQAAMLLALQAAPHCFRRAGKGRFKKAPLEQVQAARLAIERKAREAEQIEAWADALIAGHTPDEVREQLYKILFKPDKNALAYKAVVQAAQRSGQPPLALLQAAGAIASPYQFHWQRFLFEQFPAGHGFAAGLAAPPVAAELPLAPVQAFSIDDSHTTEIDDALSVEGLGSGSVVVGIHIAVPGLAIAPDSPLDKLARARLSTVYMPGGKITMLPDAVVQAYTLIAGRECPALSLYVTLDEATLAVQGHATRLERVFISDNLRHDQLDAVITEAALTGAEPAAYPHAAELALLFRLARTLKAAREQVRGKPETFARPDYSFKLLDEAGQALRGEPTGSEQVVIAERQRGAPLDLIVSEAMILANSHWGGWLAQLGVPGIYRSQAALAPGIKVRMGTKALPHAGMGVAQYTWATSPLRRYVDLVNQWQLLACVQHGATAALAAPFKPKDATLFSVISAFDEAYTAYNAFQSGIERYWTLRWLQQTGTTELAASVLRDGLVRADALPLVFSVAGAQGLERGTRVMARLNGIDLLTLELHATLASVLASGAPADTAAAAAVDEDDEAATGLPPPVVALDLSEADALAAAEPAPAAPAA